ncbi:MAG TPA: tetratricopeptide repeat protein [Vicinamibacteria bacterium]|nr:tetratricopeptide repeat protein [Vicinamibacteria bacterium]
MSLLLLLLLQPQFTTPLEAFGQAEKLYQEERYSEAIEVYESIRASGVEDGFLLYNLGNAYFKSGRLGLAIVSYERALRLLPGDDDVRANLAFANTLVSSGLAPPPLPLAIGWAVEAYLRTGPAALAWSVGLSFLAGGIAVSILLLDRWPHLRTASIAILAASGAVALVAGASLYAKLQAERTRVEGIVVTENAYVRSGPLESSPRLAEIHEGLKVRIVGEREEFLQVTLANGITGWLPREQVERI